MKVYLAGMGVDDKELLKLSKKHGNILRRLITYAYKSDADKILKLKQEELNGTKKTVRRIRKRKSRNSQ